MKAVKLFAALALTFCLKTSQAQSPDQSALLYADSLLQAYLSNNIDVYANLSYPGMVSYYGGSRNFRAYMERARAIEKDETSSPDKLQVIQLETRGQESQCVIQRSHETLIDNRKAVITSYLIGQSTDGGSTWKFVDVALNSVENISYIMPDVFTELAVPVRQVKFI